MTKVVSSPAGGRGTATAASAPGIGAGAPSPRYAREVVRNKV
jgi:hypothetical protein